VTENPFAGDCQRGKKKGTKASHSEVKQNNQADRARRLWGKKPKCKERESSVGLSRAALGTPGEPRYFLRLHLRRKRQCAPIKTAHPSRCTAAPSTSKGGGGGLREGGAGGRRGGREI